MQIRPFSHPRSSCRSFFPRGSRTERDIRRGRSKVASFASRIRVGGRGGGTGVKKEEAAEPGRGSSNLRRDSFDGQKRFQLGDGFNIYTQRNFFVMAAVYQSFAWERVLFPSFTPAAARRSSRFSVVAFAAIFCVRNYY